MRWLTVMPVNRDFSASFCLMNRSALISLSLHTRTSAGHLVVGEFTGAGGGRYILIANASCYTPFAGDIAVSASVKKLAEVPKEPGRKMKWQDVPKDGHLRSQNLAAGDGRLYAVK